METPEIKFGTDGWRGIIASDFTFDNAVLVGTAVHHYLLESGQGEKPLIVGYDRRFAAESFAAHTANHLKALGRRVIMMDAPCPTPVTAFSVKQAKAAGAIMFTASHNPYYYQGIKFIPHFAGPAMPEATDRITELIAELASGFEAPPLVLEWKGDKASFKEEYFKHLDTIVNVNSLPSSGWSVLYNAMHGVGTGYLDEFLKRSDVEVKTMNTSRDVYFGGKCLPDPSPDNLVPLASKIIESGCSVLIGTDGDADRFGIVDTEGHYFSANHALPLLADYLIRYKQKKGPLVRTVATSHLVDAVAEEAGLELIETAVGFKYVGDELRKGGLIGGEESGGISIQGHIPEKDGILAALLILELVATSGDDIQTLYDDLGSRFGSRAFVRIDQEMHDDQKKSLMDGLMGYGKDKMAGRKIAQRITKDGAKFVFEDGSWMLCRASGTEPVMRVYIEATPAESLNKLKTQIMDELKTMI